ncbi:hypothetical protein JL722_3110 [Aureococcus anophagefferens]|nr:hypothetical protein JL722_3110 [Aureococcus anophagefferens]
MRGFLLLLVVRTAAYKKAYKIVVFKESRTGSTWMADMLAHEPAVAYFEHEANNCFNKKVQVDPSRVRSDTLRTFLGILGAPRCNMTCRAYDDAGVPTFAVVAAAEDPRARPGCLAGKIVGFDVAAEHLLRQNAAPLTWRGDWPRLLRLPDVTPVVYARSNLVKRKLAAGAHGDALKWSSLLDNVTEAAGGARPFVMYYEALQLDPKAEIERLFAAVGLGGKGEPVPEVLARSTSVKITSDDLRRSVANFDDVALELDALDPCLAAQFRDADSAVFADLCLPGNRRVPWEP